MQIGHELVDEQRTPADSRAMARRLGPALRTQVVKESNASCLASRVTKARVNN